ncbi:MAG TPA: hypothetical protein VGC13_22310 [Longimicrobium sp.]|jgi:hypothetical protein|uniref:hypothetical protein n=1 Tax=Longimicrobium sp. TaxID=2029185 RepID=UPI002ED83C93
MAMLQMPSMGRVVHYVDADGNAYPAVIRAVLVDNPEIVRLTAFDDEHGGDPCRRGTAQRGRAHAGLVALAGARVTMQHRCGCQPVEPYPGADIHYVDEDGSVMAVVWHWPDRLWDQDEIDEFMAGLQSPRPLSPLSLWPNDYVPDGLWVVGGGLGAAAAAERCLVVHVSADGDRWCALIGGNLQDGIAGFGGSPPDALRALAAALDDGRGRTKGVVT